jgi:uncharacterized protein with HEPN domain
MKDGGLYLIYLEECICRIEAYTSDGRDALMASTLKQDAVLRNLEIMGEATKRLSPQLRESCQNIPWRQVAGFRDVIIHNYMGVDLDEVWNIIELELPTIKRELMAIVTKVKKR